MIPRRYELSDFEWSIIQPLLSNKPQGPDQKHALEVHRPKMGFPDHRNPSGRSHVR
jgi:transposase